MCIGRRGRGGRHGLRRYRRRVGRGLADRELHGRDLLGLVDDDLLGDAAQLLVLAVAQFDHGHVDRALMMRRHHRDEIAVDVAGRLGAHAVHHLRHRRVGLFQERAFLGRRRRWLRTRIVRQHKKGEGGDDQYARAEDGSGARPVSSRHLLVRSRIARDHVATAMHALPEGSCACYSGDAGARRLFRHRLLFLFEHMRCGAGAAKRMTSRRAIT
jgi:hypothetical protein